MAMKRCKQPQDVVVGYGGVPYTIYVHEDLNTKHKSGQMAKFLEIPARRLADQIALIVARLMVSGATLQEAMLAGGRFLQKASQDLVPVETGDLRASAFTVLEGDLEEAVSTAFGLWKARKSRRSNKR